MVLCGIGARLYRKCTGVATDAAALGDRPIDCGTFEAVMRMVGIVGLMLGVLVMGLSAADGFVNGRRGEVAFAGGRLPVPAGTKRATASSGGKGALEPLAVGREGSDGQRWVVVPAAGNQTLTLDVENSGAAPETETRELYVISRWNALGAAAAALLILFALPFVIGERRPGQPGPLYRLLAEPAGGFSLGRLQLLLWFAAASAILAALTFPLGRLPALTGSLPALFLLSGLTTLLATAANPAKPPVTSTAEAAAAMPPPPGLPKGATAARLPAAGVQPVTATVQAAPAVPPMEFKSLVEGWDGSGDLSRYQLLLLTIIGVGAVLLAFARTLAPPDLPDQFLTLVGASQATYLGTKAVKMARGS
jgi:hypothetical protein